MGFLLFFLDRRMRFIIKVKGSGAKWSEVEKSEGRPFHENQIQRKL